MVQFGKIWITEFQKTLIMDIQGTWINTEGDLKITISDSGSADAYFVEYIDESGILKKEEVPINISKIYQNKIYYKIMKSELFGIADVILTDDETMYIRGMKFSRVED